MLKVNKSDADPRKMEKMHMRMECVGKFNFGTKHGLIGKNSLGRIAYSKVLTAVESGNGSSGNIE